MKVGDYVRTKRGIIGKIKLIDNQTELEDLYLVKRQWYYKEDFIKSSPNIKSVIEEDDFVNGKRVNRVIPEDICGDELLDYQHIFVDNKEIYEEDIKSIVTKEQFESMEYKVGE